MYCDYIAYAKPKTTADYDQNDNVSSSYIIHCVDIIKHNLKKTNISQNMLYKINLLLTFFFYTYFKKTYTTIS